MITKNEILSKGLEGIDVDEEWSEEETTSLALLEYTREHIFESIENAVSKMVVAGFTKQEIGDTFDFLNDDHLLEKDMMIWIGGYLKLTP